MKTDPNNPFGPMTRADYRSQHRVFGMMILAGVSAQEACDAAYDYRRNRIKWRRYLSECPIYENGTPGQVAWRRKTSKRKRRDK